MKYKLNNSDRKHLVFLDIDGVFTSSRVHISRTDPYPMWVKFDPVSIDFMNKIHDKYRVQFVIMSTWKEHFREDDTNIFHLVEAMFRNSGFRGEFASPWKTNPDNLPRLFELDRAYEVKEYLETYANDIVDYILFDDNRYKFKEVLGKNRLVQTDHENGMLYKHMLNALSLMGNWNER
jgi:hypothetical protein